MGTGDFEKTSKASGGIHCWVFQQIHIYVFMSLTLLRLGTRITIWLIYEMYSWCIFVLQQLKPYQMAHSVSCSIARTGFWNKLSALHDLSFSTLQRTAIFKKDVREDRFMCCAWGQVVKSVKFYRSIIPCPHLVAGVSLVIFKRPETHDSVTLLSFPVPQRLSHPIHHSKCYWGWRRRHHQKGGIAPKSGQFLMISRNCVDCGSALPEQASLAEPGQLSLPHCCWCLSPLQHLCFLRPCALQGTRCNQA